jgi:hypothetical protein
MAQNSLVGNMDTCRMIDYFEQKGMTTGLDMEALQKAVQMAEQIFE